METDLATKLRTGNNIGFMAGFVFGGAVIISDLILSPNPSNSYSLLADLENLLKQEAYVAGSSIIGGVTGATITLTNYYGDKIHKYLNNTSNNRNRY